MRIAILVDGRKCRILRETTDGVIVAVSATHIVACRRDFIKSEEIGDLAIDAVSAKALNRESRKPHFAGILKTLFKGLTSWRMN